MHRGGGLNVYATPTAARARQEKNGTRGTRVRQRQFGTALMMPLRQSFSIHNCRHHATHVFA